MDYRITMHLWNLGHDEAEELVEKVAELLCDRGLGVNHMEHQLRSVVGLYPQDPVDATDLSDEETFNWMKEFAEGATMVCLPKAGSSRMP